MDQESKQRYFKQLCRQAEFTQLIASELALIKMHSLFREYDKGQLLFFQGDPRVNFYYLLSGVVRIERRDADDRLNYLEYVNCLHGFPFRGLFSGQPYAYTAKTATKVIIGVLPTQIFEQLLHQNNAMMADVVKEMGLIIDQHERRLQVMVNSSASDRVLQALKLLKKELGEANQQGQVVIRYPLTTIELAEISATTRETAGLVLQQLRKDGVIVRLHRQITFLKA